MDLARRELGEDAVLLNSRPAPPEARHLGVHEVVFGVEAAAGPTGAPEAGKPLPGNGMAAGELQAGLARIERALQNVLLNPHAPATPVAGSEPALVRFLTSLGYPGDFAKRINRRAAELLAAAGPGLRRMGSGGDAAVPELDEAATGARLFARPAGQWAAAFASRGEAARAVLAAFNECCPAEELVPDRRVLAFFGPPGSGRTTLLAKIAARAATAEGRSVVILSTDTLRIAAAEQLRTYAGIMGVACEIHETPRALARALRDHAGRDLVLIDTPGWSPAQLAGPEADAAPWRDAWGGEELEAERHLVLPAWLGPAHWQAAGRRFAPFGPTHLALTHWDECIASGPALAYAASCGLRLSWLSFGQSVPEDCEVATRARWLDLAMGLEAPDPGEAPEVTENAEPDGREALYV